MYSISEHTSQQCAHGQCVRQACSCGHLPRAFLAEKLSIQHIYTVCDYHQALFQTRYTDGSGYQLARICKTGYRHFHSQAFGPHCIAADTTPRQ